jgi:DNA-dependent RNA polymerase auxiliary subunit epsilon
MVQKGVVETSGTKSLYYSNNSKEAVIKFLINCNFKIDKEELLGDGSIEYNIHFSKI